ncbi:permease [Streptococcus pyogenes]|nr:permease [Streptococcus pyogenes]QAX70485.1 permease [Streptococcus pyogenes]TYL21393.1 permease [Streptococcus pyogenes]
MKALSKVFLGIMTFPRFHLILCLLYYTKSNLKLDNKSNLRKLAA